MNNLNDLTILQMKRFLLNAYVETALESKRKYYGLVDEEESSFDDGWGIPNDLSMKEFEILQVFKYCKGWEDMPLLSLKEKWMYDLFTK